MDRKLIRAIESLDEETVEAYERMEALLLDALRRTQALLAVLGRKNSIHQPTIILPPSSLLDSIRAFLRQRGNPTKQSDIIATVGGQRERMYPELLRPYGDVLKSLAYHDKHDGEIVCVKWHGTELRRADMQRRPRQPRMIGGRKDSAKDYLEPENIFWFRDEIATARLPDNGADCLSSKIFTR